MKDVLLQPPTAHMGARGNPLEAPSAEELCAIYWREISDLRKQLRELGDTASSISAVALCLHRMLSDAGKTSGPNEVTITKWLHTQMVGASITVGQNEDGSISVRLRESGRERLAVVQ